MTTKTKEVQKVKGESAKPINGAETNNRAEVKEIAKQAASIAESVTRNAPKMTVEERFNKLEEFQALQMKHSKIKAKNQSLKVLRRSNDTLGAEISITAGSEEITLNNAFIVGEVLELLSGKLEKLNEQTENEVLNFVI
jgi:hypothetical protein